MQMYSTAKKSKVRQNEKEKAHLLQQRPSITDLHGRRVEHIESRGAVTVAAVIVPMPIGLPELTLLTSAHCVLCFVAVKIKPKERERESKRDRARWPPPRAAAFKSAAK